jgi:hypothetical protein
VERRYSEEQVSEIIRRAAEISSTGIDSALSRGSGVTESELKRIASEIGLDAEAVDAAMRETGAVVSNDTGGDLSWDRSYERRIDGEVSAEQAHATLVEHFVPEWDPFRGTTKIGSLVTYKSSVGINTCHVSIARKSGRTILKVTSNAWVSMMATFLPATLLSVLACILILSSSKLLNDKLEILVPLLAVLWITSVVANMKLVKFSNKKVERLTDAAAADLAESADHLRSRLANTSAESRIEVQGEQLT